MIGIAIVLYLATYNFPAEYLFPDRFKNAPAEFADRVRWFGILLEVFAIATIAYGLSQSLAAFDRPKLVARFFHRVGEFRYVFIRRPPVHSEANVMLGAISLAAGVMTSSMNGGTVQEQLDYLKRSMAAVQESVGKAAVKLDQLERDFKKGIEEEATQRRLADKTMSEALEQQTVGDVHIQIAGLTLLLVSIFMANAPTESSLLLHSFGLGYRAYW